MKLQKRNQVIELFRESIIIQSMITLIVVSTLCIMILAQAIRPEIDVRIPESLYIIVGTILGYWFKTKDRFNAETRAARMLVDELRKVREDTSPTTPA